MFLRLGLCRMIVFLAKSHYLLKLADYYQFLLIGYVLHTVTEYRYCAPTR